MNVIGQFILGILKRIAQKETPFLIGEGEALLKIAEAALSVQFDSTLSADEKRHLFHLSTVALQTIVATAESEGKQIANDTLSILTGALGDELSSAFGFSK